MAKKTNASSTTQAILRRFFFTAALLFQFILASDAFAQTTFYSRTDVAGSNFNVTTAWTDSPSGIGGADPVPGDFTSGAANFIILSGTTRTVNSTTTINSLTVNSGGTLSGGGTLNLNGDLTINGTNSLGAGSNVNFIGTASASIGGSASITFGNLTVDKTSGTVTSGTNSFAIRSEFTIRSNFTAGSGLITLSDANLIISGGTANFSAGSISLIGTITDNSIETNQDISLVNLTLTKGTDPAGTNFILQSNNTTTRIFTITGTLTRQFGTLTVGGAGRPAELRYVGDASTLSYSGMPMDDVAIGAEFVTDPTFRPKNLTINIPSSITSSSSYIIDRNLTLTQGTIDLGSNTLTVLGDITGSTIAPGTANISDATTLNLGGGSTSTQLQNISSGSITLTRLTIDKRVGASPANSEGLANTVNVDGALNFRAGGQLNIASGTLRFLSDGRLAGPNLGTLNITIGSATRRGVLRTGGTDITTGIVGTVDAQQGTNGVNSKVIYDGSTGSSTMRTGVFGVIEINRAVSVGSGTTDVTSELAFRTGVISGTSGSAVLRLRNATTVSYLGSATAQTSFVSGPVVREFTATGSGDFPVGKGSAGNRVTYNFTTLSAASDITLEQFNVAPGGTAFPTDIGAVSTTRYWTSSFSTSPTVAYSIQADIAGTGIPSPLNRVLFGTAGAPAGTPTYGAAGFPAGSNVADNGTRTVNTGSPFTLTSYGATPNFFTIGESNLLQIIAIATGDWNSNSTWNLSRPPLATENVRYQSPNIVVTVSGVGPQPVANSITTNQDGVGLILNRAGTPIEIGGVGQWNAARTTFTRGFVEYQQGNVYGDTYDSLIVNNTAAVGTVNSSDGVSAITVLDNFIKQGAGAFTAAAANPITVAGNYFNVAGNATYTGALSVTGNATVTAGSIGGTVTVSGGTLTMNGGGFDVAGGVLTLNNPSGSTVNGTLANPQFANLTLTIGTSNLDLGGSVTTLGVRETFTLNDGGTGSAGVTSGTILMNGSAAQNVNGTGNSTVTNLQINNSAGVTLNRVLTATGTLTMTSGLLNTTTTNLMTAANTSLGSTTSFVNGPLAITGTGTAIYPIGNGAIFRPVEVADKQTGSLRIQSFNAPAGSAGAVNPATPRVSDARFWNVTVVSGSPIDTSTTLAASYDNSQGDGVTVPATVQIATATATPPATIGSWTPRGNSGTPTILGLPAIRSLAGIPTSGTNFYTFYTDVPLPDNPLPVELVSFVGTGSRKGIELSWRTGSERESFGFVVNRRRAGGNWQVIDSFDRNPSLRARNSLTGAEYFYIDRSPMNIGDVFEYRLDEVAFDGTVDRLKEIRVEATFSTIVTEYALDQNYPNPFNPSTTIPYQLKDRAKVTLDIYNALGQKIATVVSAEQESGRYAPTFNAASLASGMYFYRLQVVSARENFTQTRKMMLVK